MVSPSARSSSMQAGERARARPRAARTPARRAAAAAAARTAPAPPAAPAAGRAATPRPAGPPSRRARPGPGTPGRRARISPLLAAVPRQPQRPRRGTRRGCVRVRADHHVLQRGHAAEHPRALEHHARCPAAARRCGGSRSIAGAVVASPCRRPRASWPPISVEQGGLAGAVRADDGAQFAVRDVEVDVAHGVHPAERRGAARDGERRARPSTAADRGQLAPWPSRWARTRRP